MDPRFEFNSAVALLHGSWSSALQEPAKEKHSQYIVDNLSYLINEEIDDPMSERKIHLVLLSNALRCSGMALEEKEEEYFESCLDILPKCSWELYLETIITCLWGDFFVQALSTFPHHRSLESLKNTLKSYPDSLYFNHLILQVCVNKIFLSSKAEEIEAYFDIIYRMTNDSTKNSLMNLFLHGVTAISLQILTSQPDAPHVQEDPNIISTWISLEQSPLPKTNYPLNKHQLSNILSHIMILFEEFFSRFSNWLDSFDLEINDCLPLEQFLMHMAQVSLWDFEYSKLFAMSAARSLGTLISICANFNLVLPPECFKIRDYLDIFKLEVEKFIDVLVEKKAAWMDILEITLTHEEALMSNKLLTFLLKNAESLDWKHLHLLFYWILEQKHVNAIKEVFLNLCIMYPHEYQEHLLYHFLNRIGLSDGLRLDDFNKQLTVHLNQSQESKSIAILCLQSPLEVLEAILNQVLNHQGQITNLSRVLASVPSLCNYKAAEAIESDPPLLIGKLQDILKDNLSEQQETHFLAFIKSTLQIFRSAGMAYEKDFVHFLVLPSLHLEANFHIASSILKLALDSSPQEWLDEASKAINLPALIVCLCQIAHHYRISQETRYLKEILDMIVLLSTSLADQWLKRTTDNENIPENEETEMTRLWIKQTTRQFHPTLWPYLVQVCPLTSEECSLLKVGLIYPSCTHLPSLLPKDSTQAYLHLVTAFSKILPYCTLSEWEVACSHFTSLLHSEVITMPQPYAIHDVKSCIHFIHAVMDSLILACSIPLTLSWQGTLTTLGSLIRSKFSIEGKQHILIQEAIEHLLQLSLVAPIEASDQLAILVLDLLSMDPNVMDLCQHLYPLLDAIPLEEVKLALKSKLQ